MFTGGRHRRRVLRKSTPSSFILYFLFDNDYLMLKVVDCTEALRHAVAPAPAAPLTRIAGCRITASVRIKDRVQGLIRRFVVRSSPHKTLFLPC